MGRRSASTWSCCQYYLHQRSRPRESCVLTNRAPLTITRMPPVGLLGCASIVATWCSTFSNGRPCILSQYSLPIRNPLQNAYFQLLQYCRGPLAWRCLECEHGLIALLSRCQPYVLLLWSWRRSSYVEGCELTAVCVEGLVVVLDELLCGVVRLVAQARRGRCAYLRCSRSL